MTPRQTVPCWAAGLRFCHPDPMTTTAAPVAAPRARTPLSHLADMDAGARLRSILPAAGTARVEVASFSSSL